mgnify:CR=1 FL=1
MAKFPEAWMQELLGKSDLAAIASEYTQLKPNGRRLWGCCPFHSEKTPSFSVTPDNQLYYCFGCHAGGGVVQFVMEAEKLTYTEAVKSLAQRAGMELPEEVNDERLRKERVQKERLYAACKEAARFYVRQLLGEGGSRARQYLIGRGVDTAVLKAFGLGYAPPGWDNLALHMKAQGVSEETLVEAGLAIRGKKGSVYDAYRDRVIFPIISAAGRVIGFGARAMGDETPKYLNTGDTPIFNKRYNLYGLNRQKGKRPGDLIMVEGYMDVVSLYKHGVDNAVASLGTALTAQQARLLKRYAPRVYICYDGDAAGRSATLRGMDILAREGLEVRVMSVPGGLDPDEYTKANGQEAFLSLKDEAKGLNEYRLDALWAETDAKDADGREAYAKKACSFLNTLQPVERERYVEVVARRTGYSKESLRAQTGIGVGPQENSAGKNRHTKQNKPLLQQAAGRSLEVTLLACMIKSEEALLNALGRMQELATAFPTAELNQLSERLLAEKPDLRLLMGELPAETASLLSRALEQAENLIDPVSTALDCVNGLARAQLESRMADLSAAYNGSPEAAAEIMELQRRIGKLSRRA